MSIDHSETYWAGKGLHQELYEALVKLIPEEGPVANAEQFPKLERLRLAANIYYDLFNNGLCNLQDEFESVMRMSVHSTIVAELDETELTDTQLVGLVRWYRQVDTRFDIIVLNAAQEQGLLETETA